jgi:hypothetical protein
MGIAAWTCLSLILHSSNSVDAQSTRSIETIDWLTGSKLDQLNSELFSLTWRDSPIRERLIRLSRQKKVALFIDRRIDPSTPVDISVTDVSFEHFLWRVAASHDWGVARLDDFYFLGPADTAAALPILWQQLKEENRKHRNQFQVDWNQREKFYLPALSSPGDALDRLSRVYGFQVESEKLPHDLWFETDLPALTLDQRVALLVVGFGRWIERSNDGELVRLIPFESPAHGKIKLGRFENARTRVRELRESFPEVRFSNSGKIIYASGSPRQLAEIRSAMLLQNSSDAPKSGQQTYTLTTSSSRGNILASIAKMISAEFDYDSTQVAILSEQIEIRVDQVSLNELLDRVMEGTACEAVVTDQKLQIRKRKF